MISTGQLIISPKKLDCKIYTYCESLLIFTRKACLLEKVGLIKSVGEKEILTTVKQLFIFMHYFNITVAVFLQRFEQFPRNQYVLRTE